MNALNLSTIAFPEVPKFEDPPSEMEIPKRSFLGTLLRGAGQALTGIETTSSIGMNSVENNSEAEIIEFNEQEIQEVSNGNGSQESQKAISAKHRFA